MEPTYAELQLFADESNRIEGLGEASATEVEALQHFIYLPRIEVGHLRWYVDVVQPGAGPRFSAGMNVRVGDHRPPPGGPLIRPRLEEILRCANDGRRHPWHVHLEYESLHPFTDGNGRSGRALWAWQMLRHDVSPWLKLGFLHCYYYQTLAATR